MKKYILLVVMIFLALPLSSAQDWVIDGNKVYVDDSKVFIQAQPHTTAGGWVYFNLTSKVYTGDIDAVWGFDTDVARPTKAQLYNPQDIGQCIRKLFLTHIT